MCLLAVGADRNSRGLRPILGVLEILFHDYSYQSSLFLVCLHFFLHDCETECANEMGLYLYLRDTGTSSAYLYFCKDERLPWVNVVRYHAVHY